MAQIQRIVGVDWSGDKGPGQRKKIWAGVWTAPQRGASRAEVRLEGGRTRGELIEWLIALSHETPRMVVGFDFSFSFPAWFLAEHGVTSAPEFWQRVADGDGERWLHEECADARFWGKIGVNRDGKKPAEFCGEHAHRMLRKAESLLKVRALIANPEQAAKVAGIAPKSVFQIGGAGAVGTASLRGMPCLLRLREAGFRVWPFDRPEITHGPLVVEIYTRLMTGAVIKSSEPARRAYLAKKGREHVIFAGLPRSVLAKARSSEDSFDALVTTLMMAEHRAEFTNLRQTKDPIFRMEGQTWAPGLFSAERPRV
ncbi:hypothetical protein [Edaphobacter flagellatus]|uniref:hypothetical protein n=1 Tax=Edaphobacter flagellatus TaxID=1933044 RepID=UPI0021B38745|nr:hypothetical protein [Edaphobacter flagellatus]